jgi:hypothetical protein
MIAIVWVVVCLHRLLSEPVTCATALVDPDLRPTASDAVADAVFAPP